MTTNLQFDPQGFNAVLVELNRLGGELTTANNNIVTLTQTNQTLQNTIQQLQAAPAHAHAPRPPKVSPPQIFNGKREENVDVFLSQIQLNIAVNHDRFPDDISKVWFMLSYLKETAGKWAEPIITSATTHTPSPLLTNFNGFKAEFVKMFGQADKEGHAIRTLTRLRQTSSAAEYKAQFVQIGADVPWDERSKMHQFRRGLKENVKDQLALIDPPTNFEALTEMAIRIDTRLFERNEEKRNTGQAFSKSSFQPFRSHPSRSDAMDIDTTKEEKDKRRKLGLCLLCGGKGHFARSCPKAKPRIKLTDIGEEESIPRTMPELMAALKAAGISQGQEEEEEKSPQDF